MATPSIEDLEHSLNKLTLSNSSRPVSLSQRPASLSQRPASLSQRPASLRPTFYFRHKPIRAAGALFYKHEGPETFVLMINNKGVYEDIGGKTDTQDNNYFDTIRREVFEETNGVIKYEDIFDNDYLYLGRAKYMLHFIKSCDYDCAEFGTVETHTRLERTFEWVNVLDYKNKPLHRRINVYYVTNKVKALLKNNIG